MFQNLQMYGIYFTHNNMLLIGRAHDDASLEGSPQGLCILELF